MESIMELNSHIVVFSIWSFWKLFGFNCKWNKRGKTS